MKLPKRGLLMRKDGIVIWAWEHPDPTTEFHALPPYTTNLQTGEVHSAARPDDVILDLEEVTAPGDLPELYRDLSTLRVEKTSTGSYCLKQHVAGDGEETLLLDHPIMARINARRQLEGKQPLPTTPDRVLKKGAGNNT